MGKLGSVERGYGVVHRRLRVVWAARVAAGGVCCARCGGVIVPGSRWDLGHTDDRSGWVGPEHASCNRAAGARVGNARRGRQRLGRPSREW